jgi:hypothetical protein
MPLAAPQLHNSVTLLRMCCILTLTLLSNSALAIEWPQEITAKEGTIVIYQPQPEKLEGNVLSGRAATSLELKDQSDPIFEQLRTRTDV